MSRIQALVMAVVIAMATALAGCGGKGGGNTSPADPPPKIGTVAATTVNQTGTAFPTGRLVRIDIQETAGATITGGTIRIVSASQRYDSGEQPLKFGSIFYEWDTTGLNPANDYAVKVTLTDSRGQSIADESLVLTLAPNPPAINKLVSTVDVSVQARGFPVNVVRTYLLDSKFDGPIGYGWTHSYRMRAVETRTNTLVGGQRIQVDGTVQIFNADGTGSVFAPLGNGNYQSSKGDYRTLTKAADGRYALVGKHGDRFTFAPTGELLSLADRRGNTQVLTYDASGRLIVITDTSGQQTTFAYDTASRISSITDPIGRATRYTYGTSGNLVAVTNHADVTVRYAYDSAHGLTTVTDPLGKRQFFAFDASRRLASVTGEDGANRVTFQYAVPTANQMTITDALGQATVLTYDNNGAVTRVVDPAGNASTMTYDSQRNLVSLVDAGGNRSTFTYDAFGNLLTSTDAMGNTATLTYAPPFNQAASLTDARGKTTAFAYDAQGNLIGMTYPGGARESYTYDEAGRLASKTDRKNQTIAFSYDTVGQLTRKSFPDGSSHQFAYDAAGNLVSAIDASGTIALAYDAQDRLVTLTYPSGDIVSYAYDAAGNRTQLVYPNGKTLSYSYDALNRLVQISEAGQMVAHYTYDALGRVSRRDLTNGTFTTYVYDSASQLLELANRESLTDEVISSFAYTYDGSGNRLTMTTQAGTTRYAYDAINQLISVVRPDSAMIQYDLDAAGNRASVTEVGSTTTYSTNDLNQYTAVGSEAYQYDANGNMTSKSTAGGTTMYAYDFENRLVRVATPTEAVSYSYDPFGRRNSKTTQSRQVDFIHDGLSVIVERVNSNVEAIYVHGRRIDEVLVMQRGNSDYFYGHDGLGSVADLTDSSARVVESYSYDAYGFPNAASSVGNPYLFTGREYESELRLYFYRARFYDPRLGRFISADPVHFRGGANFYRYVENSPTNRTDSLGLYGEYDPNANWPSWMYSRRTNPFYPFTPPNFGYQSLVPPTDWSGVIDFGSTIVEFGWDLFLEVPDFFGIFIGTFGNVLNFPGIDDSIGPGDELPEGSRPDSAGGPAGAGGNRPNCNERGICFGDPTFIQPSGSGSSHPNRDVLPPLGVASRFALVSELAAKISTPNRDSLVRADIPVFGQAHGSKFRSYRLEFGEGADPTRWFDLVQSSRPEAAHSAELGPFHDTTIRGNLGNWDTGLKEYVYLPAYPPDHPTDLRGTHTLRVVVEGLDGQTVEDRVTVHVASVIPNAWGTKVTSKDGRFVLDVPEQAVIDAFRLVMAQPADSAARPTPLRLRRVGPLWEVREPGERFTKEVTLRLAIDEEALAGTPPTRLAIYGYDDTHKRWDRLPSQRSLDDKAIVAKVRRLHGHYALFAGDDIASDTSLEPVVDASPMQVMISSDSILLRNDFEHDMGQWSNRDHEVGGIVSRDARSGSEGGKRALKATNPRGGGNFAVNITNQPFDARDFPLVQFDYRIGSGVKTNFLVKVAGRWYDIGFTDDPKELRDKRVNIAPIGQIEGIVADGRWHTARFNLDEMLRTRTRHTVVEEMIMADWDVGGYMKLQFGTNAKGATYWIDNFSIGRDPAASPHLEETRLLVDDFNAAIGANVLGGETFTFGSAEPLQPKMGLEESGDGTPGHALRLDYDVEGAGSFAGYMSLLRGLDARNLQALRLRVRRGHVDGDLLVGLKDRSGHESKVRLFNHLAQRASAEWQQVVIPLSAFAGLKEWSSLENVSMSFTPETHATGTVWIDDLAFVRDLPGLLVDDFERGDQRNALGLEHAVQVAGAAAINGQVAHNSPNRVFRIAYGGTIGVGTADVGDGELKSWARWSTQLGGIDCSGCGELSLRIRGSEGGEDLTLYLDDGNFRWGVQLSKLVNVSRDWQTVTIPLSAFNDYGVDLTHLTELQAAFEGHRMSGTVFLDDIRLGPALQ